MKKSLLALICSAFIVGSLGQAVAAPAAHGFTPKQKKEIGEVVKQYLLDNPAVLIEVTQKLRAQQMEAAQKQALKVIGENVPQLVSETSPVLGNPNGSIVMVQFIDYQCGHCKEMYPVVSKLTAQNPQLKVVSKNLGILGDMSVQAAKASLAANMQGKFLAFHALLEQAEGEMTDEKLRAFAKQVGLDLPKFEQDMKSDKVSKEMASSEELAKKIGFSGTPVFIILSNVAGPNTKVFFIGGAVPQETLQNFVNQAKS